MLQYESETNGGLEMNRLRQVRRSKGLTLEKVAKDTGISIANLSRYESVDVEPRRETWIKLADYYDVPASYLMGLPEGLIKYIDFSGNMTFENLHDAVVRWGYERSIVNPKNTPKQFMKVTEELGELSEGINKDNQGQIKDSLGDILVTLIILSKDLDVDLLDCLRGAYDVIKDRTGKTVNGVFVKEEDLHE